MGTNSVLAIVQQQLAKLSRQVNGQLLGNDPSTNYRQLLQLGGNTSGWFQLTNNGVNTIINNATTAGEVGGTPVPQPSSLQSVDIASGDSAVVGPTTFMLVDGTTNNVIAALFNNTETGALVLQPGSISATNSLTATSLPELTLVGTGTNRGTADLTELQLEFTQRLITGSAILKRQGLTVVGILATSTFLSTGSTIDSPTFTGTAAFSGTITLNGGATIPVGQTLTINGSMAGTHGQNVGTGDSPTFSDLTTAAGDLNTILASLQSQINALVTSVNNLSTNKADHGTYSGGVTGTANLTTGAVTGTSSTTV